MNNSSKAIIISTFGFLLLFSASAYAGNTDAQNLALCKSSVVAQVGEVERMKTAGMKSRRDFFEAKFRISDNGDRYVLRCRIDQDQVAKISCVNGDACSSSSIAALSGGQ